MSRWNSPQKRIATLTIVGAVVAVGLLVLFWDAWFGPVISEEVRARLADPATRAAEATRLGDVGIEEATPLLAELTKVNIESDRLAAVRALGKIGGSRAVRALQRAAADESVAVRQAVAEALAEADAASVSDALQQLLQDESPHVRAAAVRALPDRSSSAAVADALLAAVRDSDERVRLASIDEASRQPAATAFAALSAGVGHADTRTAEAAAAQARGRRESLAPLALQAGRAAESDEQLLESGRMMQLVADARMTTALLDLLDASTGKGKDGPPAALIAMVTETLGGIEGNVAEVLVEQTVLEERSGAAEAAALQAMRNIGPRAARPLIDGLLAWRIFPDGEELKRWINVLGDVADADGAAAAALNRAAAQGVAGMEAVIADARQRITERTGKPLPPLTPDADLVAGQPADAAWQKIGGGPMIFMPKEPTADALPDNGVVHIKLTDGITWSDAPSRRGAFDFMLVLTRRDGRWAPRFHSYAPRFNKRTHLGRIIEAPDGTGDLRVEMILHNDLWRHAAFAEYTITLTKTAEGIDARYAGTCNGEPQSGPATLTAWAHAWDGPGVPQLQPDEHPRMLFRAGHVEQLRQRVKTPVGRLIFQALMHRVARGKHLYRTKLEWVTNWQPGIDQAIGHGFVARLYGDKRHAQRAIELIMPRTLQRPYGGEHGERYPEPLSYYPFAADLVFDEYDEEQLKTIRLGRSHMRMAFSHKWGPIGVFAVSRSLLGVPMSDALVMLHEPGRVNIPRPEPPPVVITVDAEQPPESAGEIVEPFKPQQLITNWLWAGRVPVADDDPLASLGGRESAWISDGQSFDYKGSTYTFAPVHEKSFRGLAGLETDDYLYVPGEPSLRCLLYTVLEVQEPEAILVPDRHWGDEKSAVYFQGKRYESGTVLILQPGRHRLLLEIVGGVINPRFPEVRAGYAKALWKKHAWQMRNYEEARERWKQTGRMQDMPHILELTSYGVRTSLLTGDAEPKKGQRQRRGKLHWAAIAAHWLCTGEALPPDMPWTPASDPDAAPVSSMSDRELCFMMGAAPDQLRPAMAAEFRRRFIEGGRLHELSCLELVGALVHYPMDLEQ